MVLPRSTVFRTLFTAHQSSRIAGARASSRVLQQATRRTYASGSGEVKKSSDLPWIIGSIAFTVPAASFLLKQSPAKPKESEIHIPHHKDPEEPHVSEKAAARQAQEEEEVGKTEPERGIVASKRDEAPPGGQPVRSAGEEAEKPTQKSTASESVKSVESEGPKEGTKEDRESAKEAGETKEPPKPSATEPTPPEQEKSSDNEEARPSHYAEASPSDADTAKSN